MFTAQVAVEAFNKAIDAVSEFIKKGIDAATEEQQVMAQTAAVINSTGGAAGMTAQAVEALAKSLSAQTTYSIEAVQQADNILLRYTAIGKDVYPQATMAILNLSAAKKQDTETSAAMIGRLLEHSSAMAMASRQGIVFTDAQIKLGRELEASGKMGEYQAMVLKALETSYGGSAAAARDTFGGAMTALNRDVTDGEKAVGRYAITLGRDLVESLDQGARKFTAFLESAQGHEAITQALSKTVAVMSVAASVIGKVVDSLAKVGKTIFDDLGKAFGTLSGKANENNVIFATLGKIVAEIVDGLALLGSIIHLVITTLDDLMNAGKASADFLGKLGDALAHMGDKSKWDAVKASGTDALNAFTKTGADFATNLKDATTKTLAFTGDLFLANKAQTLDLKKTYDDTSAGVVASLNKMGEAIDKEAGTAKKGSDAQLGYMDAYNKKFNEATKDHVAAVNNELTLIENAREKEFEKEQLRQKELLDTVKKYADQGARAATDALNTIMQAADTDFQNRLTLEDKDYEKKKANITANVKDTKEQQKQLDALDKEHAAKQAKLQHDQFEVDKEGKIVGAIIGTASAVINGLSTAPFWPVGVIMGALAGVLGGIEIATIASQANPYAEGGVAEGLSLVGEKGPELAYFANPTRIFSNDQSKKIASQGSPAGDFHVHIANVSSDVDLDNGMRKAYYRYKGLRGKI